MATTKKPAKGPSVAIMIAPSKGKAPAKAPAAPMMKKGKC